MSPEFEIVCDIPCEGCLFHSVCWKFDVNTSFLERAEICIDYNFCSRNFVPGFGEQLDIIFPDV